MAEARIRVTAQDDSAEAYAVLAQESVRCRRRGVNLRLVSNQPIVARTIAACGLRRLLPMYTTVETALAPPA